MRCAADLPHAENVIVLHDSRNGREIDQLVDDGSGFPAKLLAVDNGWIEVEIWSGERGWAKTNSLVFTDTVLLHAESPGAIACAVKSLYP